MVFKSFHRRRDPEEVFTPRSTKVNREMYINRPEHERALERAIRSGYKVVIYGESGSGKSWLYKRVFQDLKVHFEVIDFTSARSEDDVDLMILECLARREQWQSYDQEVSRDASLKVSGVGGQRGTKTKQRKSERSAYERLLAAMREEAGQNKACLVLENLEHILDKQDIVHRIRSFLLLLDDTNIGKHQVQLCMVGVPAEIKDVLTDSNKFQTISNRVFEVPEVARLSKDGVKLLFMRGLAQELEFDVESPTYCVGQVSFYTDRIPQYIHDLCLHTAFVAEDSFHKVTPDIIDIAMDNWVNSNARQSAEFIAKFVRGKRGIVQSKARLLYAISRCEQAHFQSDAIEKIYRASFPSSSSGKRLQILAALRRLASGDSRLLKSDYERVVFRVITPKLRSTLRGTLVYKDANEEVHIKGFGS